MFDKTKVTDSIIGLVGVQSSINPDYPTIDATNSESRSGRNATDNPIFKVEYLFDNMDYPQATEADFNTWLTRFIKSSIGDVLDHVNDKSDFIDRQLLYQNANNKKNTETLPDGFVGYKIAQSLDKCQAFEITRCILEFVGTGDITLALYNTAKSSPVKSQTVTISDTFQVQQLNWRLDNSDDYFKGDYYFGYLTNGISVQPYKRDYENANCMSLITGVCFTPMSVTYSPTTNELFDLEDMNNVSECWGLNPDITVFDDYTDIFIQNEMLFSKAVELQMVVNAAKTYISSAASNRNERFSNERLNFIVAQLEGVEGRIEGFKPELIREVTNLKKEIKKIKEGYFADGFILNTLS